MLTFDLTDRKTDIEAVRNFIKLESEDWISEYYKLVFQAAFDSKYVTDDDFKTEEAESRYGDFERQVDTFRTTAECIDESTINAARIISEYVFDINDRTLKESELAQKEIAPKNEIKLEVYCSVYKNQTPHFSFGLTFREDSSD